MRHFLIDIRRWIEAGFYRETGSPHFSWSCWLAASKFASRCDFHMTIGFRKWTLHAYITKFDTQLSAHDICHAFCKHDTGVQLQHMLHRLIYSTSLNSRSQYENPCGFWAESRWAVSLEITVRHLESKTLCQSNRSRSDGQALESAGIQ